MLIPSLAARTVVGKRLDRRARAVIRVLGARQLAQAGLTAFRPTTAVVRAGAAVDTVHAASMVALGICRPKWRKAGLMDAMISSGFAVAGLSRRQVRSQ